MTNIYLIRNLINNKCYVGKTNSTLDKRFRQHYYESLKESRGSRPLYRAFQKYGIDNFTISLIETVSTESASKRESFWIDYHKTFGEGYNATLGGDGTSYVDRDLVVETYAKLGSVQEVAWELDLDKGTVSNILKEQGVCITPSNDLVKERYGKRIAKLDSEGVILMEFNSIREAAKSLGNENKQGGIIKACKGQRKTAFGFRWKYLE